MAKVIWKDEKNVRGRERAYHPVRALNSFVRFTGIENWPITT